MARPNPDFGKLRAELFARLGEPIVGEALFDLVGDLVYFVKNWRGQYVVINRTLVERCGCRDKEELLGRRADEIFPPPLGPSYRAQDEAVLRHGRPIRDQLEVHFYPSGRRGWCITNKLPLLDRKGAVAGLVGISKDLHSVMETGADYPAVAQAVRYIAENLGAPLRVVELAARAGLSPYQFQQRIRTTFQLTTGQLIQKMRMEEALRRLRETDDPIANVALECGYADQSAFTRKFRQTVGVSPSVCRRNSNLGRAGGGAG